MSFSANGNRSDSDKAFRNTACPFFYRVRQAPGSLCNQVAVSFKTFQQQRCAKLRHGTYASAVKAAVGHKLKRFACRAIKYRQFKDIAQLIGYNHFQSEFLCQFGKTCGGFLPVQEKKYISPIHKGMRVRGSFCQVYPLNAAYPGIRCDRRSDQ